MRRRSPSALHERLEALGVYEREKRPWLPHLTVLRFREPPAPPAARCPSWARSFRPMLLFTFHGCVPVGRSTKFSNRSTDDG